MQPKQEYEIMERYDVKVKIYSTGQIELIEYGGELERKIEGWEERKEKHVSKILEDSRQRTNRGENGRELRMDNTARSYSKMVDMAIQNHQIWRSFWTLTFGENIKELDYANSEFKKFIQKVKRKYPELKYLGVPEFQKRGAVHYHLITNVEMDQTEIIELQQGKEKMYNIKQWEHGFSSVFDLNLTDEKFSVAAYMSKYFFKDIDNRLFGRRKILASKGLDKPLEVRFLADTEEYRIFSDYLERSTKQIKEKHISPRERYMPEMVIKTYDQK